MPFYSPASEETHVCLFCKLRLSLHNNSGNAGTHLKACQKRPKSLAVCKDMPRFDAPTVKVSGPLDRMVAARVSRSGGSASGLTDASDELKSRIDEALAMLCTEHLLPYSFVEWPAMQMLMARLLESGGVAVSVCFIFYSFNLMCYTRCSFIPLAGELFVAVYTALIPLCVVWWRMKWPR